MRIRIGAAFFAAMLLVAVTAPSARVGRSTGGDERAAAAGGERDAAEEIEGEIPPPPPPPHDDLYLIGQPDDQVQKLAGTPTATFSATPPLGSTPIVQSMSPLADGTVAGNPLSAFWLGAYTGTLDTLIELDWYFNTANPESVAIGSSVDIFIYADPDLAAGTGTLLGSVVDAPITDITPAPTLEVNYVPVQGTVQSTILLEVVPHFVDTGTGLQVLYGAVSTPSVMKIPLGPVPPPGGEPPPSQFDDTLVAFGPSTVVSAHFLGSEPQVTIEHPRTPAEQAVLDPNRIFVDWPIGSTAGIGQLSRSTDGGDSFRLLIDPLCPERSRPNCATSGGGDTEEEVDPETGTLYFGDQEGLANEALTSSTDHGDSFPLDRQHPVSDVTGGTDRQWLAAGAADGPVVLGQEVRAFYAYHVPIVGQYIIGIGADGRPIPQPVPQILSVAQSGQLRVDRSPSSPGYGWIYQPFQSAAGGLSVGTAPESGYQLPTSWHVNAVTTDGATSFPWLAIDAAGNAYVSWDSEGQVFYSFSAIADPANNPAVGGVPGTAWSAKIRVNKPSVGTVVFPEVTAGDAGRIAIAFDGTAARADSGMPDDVPADAQWHTYAAVLTNATAAGGQPITIATGEVSHRVIHEGVVCTSGTACVVSDRSLLDMIDLSWDSAGRLGVVYTDNNNEFARLEGAADAVAGEKGAPFSKFAKQVAGPSVLASVGSVNVTVPGGGRTDPRGDATWPNIRGAGNLASLDILGASLRLDGSVVEARLKLASMSPATRITDLAKYNAALLLDPPANRLQYVLEFSTAKDVYFLSADTKADGTLRIFGGKLDDNDGVTVLTSNRAIGHHTDAGLAVSGSVVGDELVLRVPAFHLGVTDGTPFQSATAFAMAGPSEALELNAANIMRTVDASPPFDGVLAIPKADLGVTLAGAPNPVKKKGTLTYTATVTNAGPDSAAAATLRLALPGGATLKSATTSAGSCGLDASLTAVNCSFGAVAKGGSVTVTVAVVVGASAPSTLTAQATLGSNTLDPGSANNQAMVTTTVK